MIGNRFPVPLGNRDKSLKVLKAMVGFQLGSFIDTRKFHRKKAGRKDFKLRKRLALNPVDLSLVPRR